MANKLPDSGPISMLDVYNVVNSSQSSSTIIPDYYFETRADFDSHIGDILIKEGYNLSSLIFAFSDSVTDLNNLFSNTNITHTPKAIIAKNTTNFSKCFYKCDKLTDVSDYLFIYCPKAENFSYCFSEITYYGIEITSDKLFKKNLNVTTFEGCFSLCESFYEIPITLFDNCKKVINFSRCFEGSVDYYGELPDVWNKQKFPNVKNGIDYAKGCDNASNYNEIPSNFGGPAPAVPLSENTTKDSKYIPKITQQKTVNMPTSPISLGQLDFRELAGISYGKISLKDFYGKENKPKDPTKPEECDYYFVSEQDFNDRIEDIILYNFNDLSNLSFGFSDEMTKCPKFPLVETTPKLIFSRNMTNFSDTFYNDYESNMITLKCSELLFSKCYKATFFNNTFRYVVFENEIPENLFNNCPNAKNISSLSNCFQSSLFDYVPPFLFKKCINIQDFSSCFSDIIADKAEIPVELFQTCTHVKSFRTTFSNYGLNGGFKKIPFNLFDNNKEVVDFNSCFAYCNTRDALPDVWNKAKFPNVTDAYDYAYACTDAANYDQIPPEFKGE